MNNRIIIILLIGCVAYLGGCKKYLDKKNDPSLSVPDNLPDIELLLNNVFDLNYGPSGINTATDEYYLNASDWEAAPLFDRDAYIWNPQAQAYSDWQQIYKGVMIANIALESLAGIEHQTDPAKWDEVKGRALFLRSFDFFQLSQTFAPPYPGNEDSPYGIPLRMTSDFNQPVVRSTVKETYDRMLADFQEAASLLPDKLSFNWFGSRWASLAMLARLHLLMGNYEQAYDYSDSCLQISADLMDYNTIDGSQQFPFSDKNPEIIYFVANTNPVSSYYWIARVDSNLYKSFASDDLRKELFFMDNGDGTHYFRGTYTATYYLLNGIAVDEVYLTKAEAAVRTGKVAEALQTLNTLLQTRWKAGKYQDISIIEEDVLLEIILEERKKQLLNRGLRWSDLRRLNTDPRFQVTLKRSINGQEYILLPNDPRYVFLIPRESIDRSGITQNPR